MQTLERDRLITQHLDYTNALASELIAQLNLRGVVRYDDILAYAKLGLTKAASRFRPDRGAQFKSFSFHHIRGAVIDGLRATGRSRKHHQDWKSSFEDAEGRIAPTSARRSSATYAEQHEELETVSDPFPAFENRLALKQAIGRLPEIRRQIILLYYFESLDDRRIAKRLGYSRDFVFRHRKLAMHALAVALDAPGAGTLAVEESQ